MSKLSSVIHSFAQSIQDKVPNRELALVPGDCFIHFQFKIPESLQKAEKEDFLGLALEEKSPFPIEQLHWGYVIESNLALVYATPKVRLAHLGFDNPEDAFHLLPSFYPLLHKDGDTLHKFIYETNVLTLLVYSQGRTLPVKIISKKLPQAELSRTLLEETKQFLLKKSGDDENKVPLIPFFFGQGFSTHTDSKITYRFRPSYQEDSPQQTLTLSASESELWAADLRDSHFAKKESEKRRRAALIAKGYKYSAVVLLLLIFFQLIALGLNVFSNTQSRKIAELDPQVTRVSNKLQLAERLTQSTEQDIKPFVMLEAINPLRPDAVYFKKIRAKNFSSIEIDGESSSGISPVNEYADALSKQDFIGEVINNPKTENNKTKFEFEISFSSIPDIEIELKEESKREENNEKSEAGS